MMMVSGWKGMVSPEGRDQLLQHAAQLLDLDVLDLEDARHHLLVERVRLARVGDGGDGELLGALLVHDLHELAVLVDGQAVRIERRQERGVELLGVDLDLAVLGADDADLAANVLGQDERLARDVRHGLNQLLDLDLVEIDVVAAFLRTSSQLGLGALTVPGRAMGLAPGARRPLGGLRRAPLQARREARGWGGEGHDASLGARVAVPS